MMFRKQISSHDVLLALGPGSHDERVKELKSLLQPSPSALVTQIKIERFCLQKLPPMKSGCRAL